ncbi:Zn-ribbon domain-containing OB-fold protein [soil metagenome]
MLSGAERPCPIIDQWNAAFWDACRDHRLIAQRCRQSGEVWLPPSPISPRTRSKDWEWTTLSGCGRVWSLIVMHHPYFQSFVEEIPYNVIQVELDEGPHLLSNLICVDPSHIRIGMRVQVTFEVLADGLTLPKFASIE